MYFSLFAHWMLKWVDKIGKHYDDKIIVSLIFTLMICLQASDFTDIGDWPTLGAQGEVSINHHNVILSL